MELTKVCTSCKCEKLISDFYTQYQRPTSKCKECTKTKLRQYRKDNLEKVRELTRNRYDTRPNYYMYHAAKKRAKEKDLPFDIELGDVVIPQYCPILNIELIRSKGTISPSSPTLDKIVPEKGYVKGNIQIISKLSNTMKNNATINQLIDFCKGVIRQHGDELFNSLLDDLEHTPPQNNMKLILTEEQYNTIKQYSNFK